MNFFNLFFWSCLIFLNHVLILTLIIFVLFRIKSIQIKSNFIKCFAVIGKPICFQRPKFIPRFETSCCCRAGECRYFISLFWHMEQIAFIVTGELIIDIFSLCCIQLAWKTEIEQCHTTIISSYHWLFPREWSELNSPEDTHLDIYSYQCVTVIPIWNEGPMKKISLLNMSFTSVDSYVLNSHSILFSYEFNVLLQAVTQCHFKYCN